MQNLKTTRIKKGEYVISSEDGQKAILKLVDGQWHCIYKNQKTARATKARAKSDALRFLNGKAVLSSPISAALADREDEEVLVENSQEEQTPEKAEEDIIREQNIRFDAIEAMSRMTLENKNKALIVSGPAGVGKTFSIQMLADEYWENGEIEVEWLKGYTRPLGLYALLYKMREENHVLIIDDCDSVFRDEVGLNLLKCALDTSSRRFLSWNSKADITVEMPTGNGDDTEVVSVPKKFEYKGSIIFLTNIDFDRLVNADTRLSPHFEALMSRCHYVDVGIKSKREKFIRVKDVCRATNMLLHNFGLIDEAVEEVLSFMEENRDCLREISLRMALKIGMLRAADSEKWVDMATITCLK